MKQIYIDALKGDLPSPAPAGKTALTFNLTNHFEVPITAVYLNTNGLQDISTLRDFNPGDSHGFYPAYPGDYFLITAKATGGFMCVATVPDPAGSAPAGGGSSLFAAEDKKKGGNSGQGNGKSSVAHTVGPADLMAPNAIGPLPAATADILIPPDSPRVVVGCARIKKDKYLVREQFWHRQSDSYSLAPGEKRNISLTTQSGRQSTSSEQTTVLKSLDLGLDIGWGPISARFSASLSRTTTGFQQVTVTEQSTAFMSLQLHNTDPKNTKVVLCWQLIDMIGVFDQDDKAISTVSQAANPVLSVSYDLPNDTPPAQDETEMPPPRMPWRVERRFMVESKAPAPVQDMSERRPPEAIEEAGSGR
jgi:hypothetical protein